MSGTARRLLFVVAFACSLLFVLAASAVATELPPGGTFVDDDGIAEEGFIEAAFAAGITTGCNPPSNDAFCPHDSLTRAQMATMLVRAFHIPPSTIDAFTDTSASVHRDSINALAAAGITNGCNPPEYDRYCPDKRVTRGELSAFLVRVMDLAPATTDFFSDDAGSVFEGTINALAEAGLTAGCTPTTFCVDLALPRRQMAVFMARALGLTPDVPPERPPPPYPDIGKGKRIIYSNAEQRVWLIDEHEQLVDTYLVSGRKGIPHIGTYSVYSKSLKAYAPYGGITMRHMVRFVRPQTWGNQWAYGFHAIPRYPNGQPMQTEDELGYWRSGGCVRQADAKAAALYEWADIGTTVHAIP